MNRVADFGTLGTLWTAFLDGNSRDFAPQRGLSTNRSVLGRPKHQGRPPVSHILGYARVSTDDQDLASQKTRLESAGAFRVFADVISGKTFNRPGLTELLDQSAPVTRSLSFASIDWGVRYASCSKSSKRSRNAGLPFSRSKRKSIRRRPPASWCSMSSARLPSSNAASSPSAPATA